MELTVLASFCQIASAQISPIKLYYADWPSGDYPAPRKESILNAMVILSALAKSGMFNTRVVERAIIALCS